MPFQNIVTSNNDEDDVLNNKVFVVTTNDITSGAVGGTETAQVLISNPVGSNKKMKIFEITVGTNISTNNNIFRFYTSPTVTANGTALTPVCLHINGANQSSSMQIFKVPTVTNNGTLFMNYIAGPTSTISIPLDKKIILEAGQKILIGVRPNTTAVTYSVNVFWIEDT